MEILYPNKQLLKTTKSKLDIQMDNANSESKDRKGISFYRVKINDYVFIPNSLFLIP